VRLLEIALDCMIHVSGFDGRFGLGFNAKPSVGRRIAYILHDLLLASPLHPPHRMADTMNLRRIEGRFKP
jgi:hypothetical protein